jgi:acetyltransferase
MIETLERDRFRSERLSLRHGQVLQQNTAMLDMCKNLGFQVKSDPEESSLVIATLSL